MRLRFLVMCAAMAVLLAVSVQSPAAANPAPAAKKADGQKQIDRFSRRISRSVRRAFRSPKEKSAAPRASNTGTDIVVVAISNRNAGTYQFDGGAVPSGVVALTVTINLNESDKLA